MKKNLLFLILVSSSIYTNAQSPAIGWQKPVGDTGYSDTIRTVKPTSDGGFIAVGSYAIDGINNSDYLIIKMNSAGTVQWQKIYGGGGSDYANDVIQTTDGGYIIAGSTTSIDGDITTLNYGGSDAWIIRLNNSGNITWRYTFGGSGNDTITSIAKTASGNYAFVGTSNSQNGNIPNHFGGYDIWFMQLSPIGGYIASNSFGGTGNESTPSIIATADGGFAIIGTSNSSIGPYHGNNDVLFLKVASDGAFTFYNLFGGSYDDIGYSLVQTTTGDFYFAGQSSSANGDVTGNQGGTDVWIGKISGSTFNLSSQKSYGGSGDDSAVGLQLFADGTLVFSGSSNSTDGQVTGNHGSADYWVGKVNPTGNLLWQKSMGGSSNDYGSYIYPVASGGYIMGGQTFSTDGDVVGRTGSGNFDGWILKLESDALTTNSFELEKISIYPNPANTILNIKTAENIAIDRLIITDVTGKMIMEQHENNNNQVNIETLNSGLYFIKVYTQSGVSQNKFIKN